MALNWTWADKIGEAVFTDINTGAQTKTDIYEGNAYMIFIHTYIAKNDDKMWGIEAGKEYYEMYTFFIDKDHAKRCLGLEKDCTNIFDDKNVHLTLYPDIKTRTSVYEMAKLWMKSNTDVTVLLIKKP